ncbi:MAG: ATP-binding protein [Acidovorax sp.]|uniref:ATP-binding protein n=1 Tax=Acidovorax sp. TaxID=1872122 RepID=UPI0039E27A49
MSTGYRLQELHLYNWGAFAGRHQATIDADNTAVIGSTGSGKTTLIDALMTLLCANPRYNLASTGGHESDRDLVSYVRGASGPGNDSGDHLARTGRCVTGIAARLVRDGEDVWLGAILWFDGSSSSITDLNRRWCFARGPGHGLDVWLEEHHAGGARALGKLEKATDGLQFFTSKSAYLARLQRFFEVGPNAFTLLNRAAGLKQLNSIDDIFRELVLDDHSAFDDALQVAGSFDELAAIHAELELANRQYLALLPLRDLAARETAEYQRLQDLRLLHAALPHWFAAQGERLWRERVAALDTALDAGEQQIDAARTMHKAAEGEAHALLENYLRCGGSDVSTLEASIKLQQDVLTQRQADAAHYRTLAHNLGLPCPDTLSAQTLAEHQQQAAPALQALQAQQRDLQDAAEQAVANERNAHAALQALHAELHAVRQRPGSNLPAEFTQFRADLAEHLQLSADALPFAAELVEVQKNQQPWRGAIERALGSHRLRILVPPEAVDGALRWVNQRHNRLHVRLLEVREPATPASFMADGFARKLNIKPHAYESALRKLLADNDRHCVDSPEALRTTPHAMTREGLMSGTALHFDKQDQKDIRQNWMTGFDNRDRLAHLAQRIADAEGPWRALQKTKQSAQAAQALTAQKHQSWQQLQSLRWDTLDTAAASAQLQHLQTRLADLLDPQSDAAQAKARWEAGQAQAKTAADALRQHETAQAATQAHRDSAQARHAEYAQRLSAHDGDAEQHHDAITALLAEPPACDHLDRQERETQARTSAQIDKQTRQLADLHNDIIRQMGRAQKEDRGALTDHPQEIEALSPYLERLRVLEEEDLPAKRQSFQEYLNTASDQGVSTLLRGIEAQVTEITERIAELNQTLARVDFQSGRYLQLAPQPVVHPSLQALHKAMQHLRSERLRDDGGQAHYQALRAMVELLREHATNRRTKAAQALLDARYRLQFAVHVLDRASGEVLERRTGSQGGSGGEKEIIASYVLTASLSYALCPKGRSQPLFATIVLDEAFSKSSQAVAARIIQALREFSLHALFVTPNKELRLLRQHTRSAVLVHRRGRQAVLASMRWEELEAQALGRKNMDRNDLQPVPIKRQ